MDVNDTQHLLRYLRRICLALEALADAKARPDWRKDAAA